MKKHIMLAIACLSAYSLSYSRSIDDLIAQGFQPECIGETLNLSNLGLTSLEGLQRLPVNPTAITTLDLDGNKLEVIQEGDFYGFETLYSLNLFDNEIQVIGPRAFANLRKLGYLNLSNNKIQSIDSSIFEGLDQNFTTLNLSCNNIEVLQQNTFIKMPYLRFLYLQQNSIKNVFPAAFNNLDHLMHLDLSDNKIQYLPREANIGLINIEVLLLNNNPGIRIDQGFVDGLPPQIQQFHIYNHS